MTTLTKCKLADIENLLTRRTVAKTTMEEARRAERQRRRRRWWGAWGWSTISFSKYQ